MNPGRAYNEGYISRDLFISIGMQKAQRELQVQREFEEAALAADTAVQLAKTPA